MIGVSTLFFGIFFKIFANRDLAWRHLFTLILFANLPHFLFATAATYVPPIIMVGLAFTSFLLIKGFIDDFQLDRKLVIRIVTGLYAVFFLTWAISEITTSERFKKNIADDERAPEVHLSK
jgi:hypothetical protein